MVTSQFVGYSCAWPHDCVSYGLCPNDATLSIARKKRGVYVYKRSPRSGRILQQIGRGVMRSEWPALTDQPAGRSACPFDAFSEKLYSDSEAPVSQPLAIDHAGERT